MEGKGWESQVDDWGIIDLLALILTSGASINACLSFPHSGTVKVVSFCLGALEMPDLVYSR